MKTLDETLQDWVSTRPTVVQKLAKLFPLGSVFNTEDDVVFLLGYTEKNQLIVSTVNPASDYEKAMKNRKYICEDCWKDFVKLGNN